MLPSYPLIIGSASSDGPALANSTTATNILPLSAICTLPAGSLQIGSIIKLTLKGRISTVVTPGTLTFDVRFGSVIVFNGGAMTLIATPGQTNATFDLEALLTVRAIGTTATILGTAAFRSRAVVGSAVLGSGGAGTLLLPDTAPAVGTGFDSTSSQAINVFATWATANASNLIIIHQALIELKL